MYSPGTVYPCSVSFAFSSLWCTIKQLVPLFEIDMLLPRSIMALTNPRHLAKILEMNVFPEDVLIATLYYYVNVVICSYTYPHSERLINMWKVVSLDCVLTCQCKYLYLSFYKHTKPIKLINCWACLYAFIKILLTFSILLEMKILP